jgi:hypothetical protein
MEAVGAYLRIISISQHAQISRSETDIRTLDRLSVGVGRTGYRRSDFVCRGTADRYRDDNFDDAVGILRRYLAEIDSDGKVGCSARTTGHGAA